MRPVAASQNRRIVGGLPFVEALARRMAATMPNSIDVGDLVQDGVLGLIDAAHRFDEARGIKFETFAERRVNGESSMPRVKPCGATWDMSRRLPISRRRSGPMRSG
jgi:DNA-directed RNA polymerase specialized sigma subunit